METKTPRLLTEAQARQIWQVMTTAGDFVTWAKEQGLIADEPVDPDLLEAREIAAKYWESQGDHIGADAYRAGDKDDWASAHVALAAIKRGKELRPTLTREMVRNVMELQGYSQCSSHHIRALHAALLEQMQ